MHYFSIACMLIFLLVTLFIHQFKGFIGPKFHEGLGIVPILLLGNMFLGIYYNLSIWYKLSDQTKYGAYISLFGAVLTITLNIFLIPSFGYHGAAWVTFITYFSITAVSYWFGQKKYPIPYNLKKFATYLAFTLGVFFLHKFLISIVSNQWTLVGIQTLLFALFSSAVFMIEKKNRFNI
jgi:O-antigen/teichoic acid export membrane protein